MSLLRGGYCVWHSVETEKHANDSESLWLHPACKHLWTLLTWLTSGPYEWMIPQLCPHSSAKHMDKHLQNDNPNIQAKVAEHLLGLSHFA